MTGNVYKIGYGSITASSFMIRLGEQDYLITAKHLLDGWSSGDTLWVYGTKHDGQDSWNEVRYHFVPAPIYAKRGADIVAFPLEPFSGFYNPRSFEIREYASIGERVYFLGYPFGMTTFGSAAGFPLPLAKEGMIAGDSRINGMYIYWLDAHNNSGFSGGPVVLGGLTDDSRVNLIGVVSAYLPEKMKVVINDESGAARDTGASSLANSGLMVVHEIEQIVEAIEEFQGRLLLDDN